MPPPLGDGGFGRVVAARYKGYLVAVKSVKVTSSSTRQAAVTVDPMQTAKAALQKEITALTALKHTNIVTLVGVCYPTSAEHTGEVWMVEELADGDLVDFIASMKSARGGLALASIYKLALDIARGIAFMHEHSTTHNDLKPANVLMCKGTAVLADFGLVHAFSTSMGNVSRVLAAGTFPFMAPENMSPKSPGFRKAPADVYSFACILYEMATGKSPWADHGDWGAMEFYAAVFVEKERPALDGVPAALASLITRCWQPDAAARPTAAALVAELTQLYIGQAPPPDDQVLRRLVGACQHNGIRPDYIRSLRNLEAFDIVLICDDSTSMTLSNTQGDGTKTTRWGELKDVAKVVVEIAAAIDQDGCDVYFLNRGNMRNVTDNATVTAQFENKPSGSTPLTRTLTTALHDKGYRLSTEAAAGGSAAGGSAAGGAAAPAKRLLFIIATDGEPDGGVEGFTAALRALPENCYVQLVAVTDDEDAVAWMNDLDGLVRFVDVNDDFTSEREEVLKAQGGDFIFTKGDYIAKVLLGAIDPFFDLLDETKVPKGMAPLLYPSFPPLMDRKHLHYRSQNSDGGGPPPTQGGGAMMGGGGSGKH